MFEDTTSHGEMIVIRQALTKALESMANFGGSFIQDEMNEISKILVPAMIQEAENFQRSEREESVK